jgi:transcriptional regulator with XRE-family HTH domain
MDSNTDIAKRLGVNHSTVSRLRSGERRPSLDLFQKIVRTYKLDADSERRLLRASADPGRSGRAFSRLFDTGRV